LEIGKFGNLEIQGLASIEDFHISKFPNFQIE